MTSFIRLREFGYRLVRNEQGVVSFEYVIVAACIVAVVALAFGNTGPLQGALSGGLSAIGTALTNAVTTA